MEARPLTKSKRRIKHHGEVFTPDWMVQKMLDIPEIDSKCKDIYATFLEPSAGDGNFLKEILKRKLQAVIEQYHPTNWKIKSLWALSSIYGIEFLQDNLKVARDRMFIYYLDWCKEYLHIHVSPSMDLYKAAHFIIEKNIVRGNTLTQYHPDYDSPIVFYEWKRVKNYPSKVEPTLFALGDEVGKKVNIHNRVTEGQGSLFDDFFDESPQQENKSVYLIKVFQIEG